MGQSNAKTDLKRYRDGYPGQPDELSENDMSRFYKGEIPSTPNGDYIYVIHKDWFGDYELLERHHGLDLRLPNKDIQWLFPIREPGMNADAARLQTHEIPIIKDDPTCTQRLIQSYKLMLDFYGMQIKDAATGEIERIEPKWKARYAHLNSSFHNYLRITRILKSLGEFGFEHYKVAWLDFFIKEIYENQTLANCRKSLEEFWLMTIRDDAARLERIRTIRRHKGMSEAEINDPCDDSIVPEQPPPYRGPIDIEASTDDEEDDDEEETADSDADNETKKVSDAEADGAPSSHEERLRRYEQMLDSSEDD